MADPATLLPVNSSPLMKALSGVFADASALPAVELADLWDPRRAPAQRLPSLAADLGVQLWNPSWTVSKQRLVIARAIQLKRKRGALPAFQAWLRLVGADLVEFRAAPQKAAARRRLSDLERSNWAAQFPELRVSRIRQRHRRPGRLVAGRCWGVSRRAAADTVAPEFMGFRATVRRGDQTVVAAVRLEDDGLRIAVPEAGRRAVLGRTLAPRRLAPRASTAATRLYGYRRGTRQADTLSPGKPPVEFAPVLVPAVAPGPARVVAGASIGGRRRFLRASRAGDGLTQRIHLFDPKLARSGRVRPRGGLIAGRSRLGQPAFELRLAVDLSRRRPGRRAFPFSPRGPLRAHDPSRLAEGLAAVRAAKLGRDRVLVRTGLHRPIAAGDSLPLDGSYALGQIIRSL